MLETAGTAEVQAVMDALPPDILERIADVPITFDARPNAAMVAAGIHPYRTQGLFTGVPYSKAVAVSQHLPPQIILFLENIWNYSGGQPLAFRQNVRKTLLHEIGHYLGLDEKGVRLRGLG